MNDTRHDPLVAARLREWHRREHDPDYLADLAADRDSWRDEADQLRGEVAALRGQLARSRTGERVAQEWACVFATVGVVLALLLIWL